MPRGDGTGPMGNGAMTGRGLGGCFTGRKEYRGFGFGLGRGYTRGFRTGLDVVETDKELLKNQKEILKERLDTIDKQLENL